MNTKIMTFTHDNKFEYVSFYFYYLSGSLVNPDINGVTGDSCTNEQSVSIIHNIRKMGFYLNALVNYLNQLKLP